MDGDRSGGFLGGMNCCLRSFVVLWHVLRFDWFSVPSFFYFFMIGSFFLPSFGHEHPLFLYVVFLLPISHTFK